MVSADFEPISVSGASAINRYADLIFDPSREDRINAQRLGDAA
jgi:hypothetical protein